MTKKTLFLLKGVFSEQVDRKYDFFQNNTTITHFPTTTIDIKEPVSSVETRTQLSEMAQTADMEKTNFTFLDEAKKDHQCVVSMYNLVGQELPTQTTLHCFWCRHPFDNVPIGCPLYYVSQRIMKKMTSETSKETCILRENISTQLYDKIKGNLDFFSLVAQDYYIIDGIFCSFPCCLSFIRDKKHCDPIYKESEQLLRQMCYSIFRDTLPIHYNIPEAPSWRLLQSYGGHLTIQQFRKGFNNTHYIDNRQFIQNTPKQKMVGFVYEKQITL